MPSINVPLSDVISSASSINVKNAFGNLSNTSNFNELLTTDPIDDATVLAKNQIMHMIESWRYLAASINAFLKNSDGNAIHLAYYAELRAAISLYAASGILIEYPNHAYLDAAGNFQSFDNLTIPGQDSILKPTHKMTWGLWEHWTRTSYANELLNDGIILYKNEPTDITLGSISQRIGAISTNNLIQSWGRDLIQLTDDHDARNTHSYEPYWTNRPFTKRSQEDISFIKALWKLLLPQGYNSNGMHFDIALTKYILNEAESGRVATLLEDEDETENTIQEQVVSFIDSQYGVSAQNMKNILEQDTYDGSLFDLACDPAIEVKNVLSRAVFLSRVAKLAVEVNLQKNSNAKSWILFWLEHCGILDPLNGTELEDLDQDYEVALSDFNPSDPHFDIWHTVGNSCPASMLIKPEACLGWYFS